MRAHFYLFYLLIASSLYASASCPELPVDIFRNIGKHFDIQTIKKVRLLSRHLCCLTHAALPCLTLIKIPSNNIDPNALLSLLQRESHLISLAINVPLKEVNILEKGIFLKNLTALQRLSIGKNMRIGPQEITDLSGLQNLNQLALININGLADNHLQGLSNLVRLTHFTLTCNPLINGAFLVYLLPLTHLRDLNVSNCRNLIDDNLIYLSHLTRLHRLYLYKAQTITGEGIKAISLLTTLQDLELSGCNKINDSALVFLSNLVCLTRLDLSECKRITANGIRHLSHLMGLTNLDISPGKYLDDSCLHYLLLLTHLNNLRIDNWKLTQNWGQALTHLTRLK